MPKVIAMAEVSNKGNQYTSEVQIHQHELIVDEPMDNGGEDMGPAPGDYLCAALASCTAITLRMYVQRKKWDVGEIKVKVDLTKDEAANNIFLCEISFAVAPEKEQMEKLKTIADMCPLHKLLTKPNQITTTLKNEMVPAIKQE